MTTGTIGSKGMRFLANDLCIDTPAWAGKPALDFIREELGLKGTKEGCREGDCGACAVLIGTRYPSSDGGAVPKDESMSGVSFSWQASPSCLLALGELEGRQLVTIEGLVAGARAAGQPEALTPVMAALLAENGSQCGFCSPGVVVSLTAWLLSSPILDEASAITAVEGNLCRCTGYAAIRRAAASLATQFAGLPREPLARLEALVAAAVVPPSLLAFAKGELLAASPSPAGLAAKPLAPGLPRLGGGTDYFVRNPDPEPGFSPALLDLDPELSQIHPGPQGLELGGAVTIQDFFESPLVRSLVPGIEAFEAEFASSLIRSRATLGGNVANASPVGDLTSILLALGAICVVTKASGGPGPSRDLPLSGLYLGYKKLALQEGEYISRFRIAPPAKGDLRFSFEKVSKRRRLDIASANTALRLETEGQGPRPVILAARLSAGGMGPTPLVLPKAGALLVGQVPTAELAQRVAAQAVAETSPMSDVRGSAGYRARLLERLVLAHFLRLFPESGLAEELFP